MNSSQIIKRLNYLVKAGFSLVNIDINRSDIITSPIFQTNGINFIPFYDNQFINCEYKSVYNQDASLSIREFTAFPSHFALDLSTRSGN